MGIKRILEDGRRRCSNCKLYLSAESFGPDRSRKDGIAYNCIGCKRSIEWMRRYNLTAEQYYEMLAAQGGGCAICGGVNDGGKALAVDHDHACCPTNMACGKCTRSLLCEECNHMLGRAHDDAARLRAAADYIDKWSGR